MKHLAIATALATGLIGTAAVAQTTIIERDAPPARIIERDVPPPRTIIERDAGPTTIIERDAPRTTVIERDAPRTRVIERETTGAVTLSPDDEVRVRRYIVEERVRPVEVRESVTVGSLVPGYVTLYDFDDDLDDVPMLGSFSYFRSPDNKIVLVNPDTRRVVRIINE